MVEMGAVVIVVVEVKCDDLVRTIELPAKAEIVR